jgi:hypothetical protein
MDDGNGLLDMRARYYDPEIGRFINKDPIGWRGGINMYAYVLNNPVNFVDPLGLAYGRGLGQVSLIVEGYLGISEAFETLVAGGGMVIIGSVAGGLGIGLAIYSPVLAPFGLVVWAGGEYLVINGVTIYLNYLNMMTGTTIPTLSYYYPDYFLPFPGR